MKIQLTPIFFQNGKTDRFAVQTGRLKTLLAEEAELLPPVALGEPVPECDGVIFPEILGEAYRRVEDFRRLGKPILIVTSEFGTFSMWDWEIMNFLKGHGVATLAPYNLDLLRLMCRTLAVRKAMREAKFVVFQDNPGEGFQPEIFKSFYWWEEGCVRDITERFGITVERRSLRELGRKAEAISDGDALAEWRKWEYPTSEGFDGERAVEAARLYLALREEVDSDSIVGMGTNCLNESRSCRSTPCLAWDRLLEERGILWACEGDVASMASMFLLRGSLGCGLMMTNIYPFLMGLAATKHEKIPGFPEIVDDPENHILMGHCGYFGLVPRRFSREWVLREKVLAIVDERSHVFDARLRPGPVTLSKLDASMRRLMGVRGRLRGYVQYDRSSDCRNGGIVRVEDGKRFLRNVYSHHVVLMEGDWSSELEIVGSILDLEVDAF